jgi:hypothetical protein
MMEEVLNLVKEFGLSLVIAIGALYALYQFFFFSMEELKVSLAEVKSDLKILVELLKSSKGK